MIVVAALSPVAQEYLDSSSDYGQWPQSACHSSAFTQVPKVLRLINPLIQIFIIGVTSSHLKCKLQTFFSLSLNFHHHNFSSDRSEMVMASQCLIAPCLNFSGTYTFQKQLFGSGKVGVEGNGLMGEQIQ